MIIGTTPSHTVVVGVPLENVKTIEVTYKQDEYVVLEKNTEDCEIDYENQSVIVHLTQKDTFDFKPKIRAKGQMRILMNDGNVIANKEPFIFEVAECFSNEVLV